MRTKLSFNLADREKHFDTLKKLYGITDATKNKDRKENNSRTKQLNPNPK